MALGGRRPAAGCFYPATVLTDVPPDARILKEEVFGPVALTSGSTPKEEGIAAANDTEYGLASLHLHQSLDRALRPRRSSPAWSGQPGSHLRSRAPFGGVKESGSAARGGYEGIEEYLDTKYIALTKWVDRHALCSSGTGIPRHEYQQ